MTSSHDQTGRSARLRWVPIADMRVDPVAQRQLKQPRVDYLAANFDLESIGYPTLNQRADGHWYIIDGQHRVAALRQIGWGDQQIQCQTYVGLSVADEAATFLRLNNNLRVSAFSKFVVAVTSGDPVSCDIDRVVRAQGLVIANTGVEGGIRAVSALAKVYDRGGAEALARTLRIIRDAFGDPGLDGTVIEGIGLLVTRYENKFTDEHAVTRLSKILGGVSGLLNKSEVLRRSTGSARSHCIAAAAVDALNSTRGGAKLPGWWAA